MRISGNGQLRVIGLTLARKLPRREHEGERMKRALIEERADLEADAARRTSRSARAPSTARRGRCLGRRAADAGTVESRCASAEGLDFTEHLPEARGEPPRSRASASGAGAQRA